MAVPLTLGPVHHLRLTVTDVQRSRAFYTELLGFQIAMDTPPPADDPHHDLAVDLLQDGIVMVNGDLLVGLRPVDAARASDRFDPFRCGLDHLSFAVAGRAELEAAVQAFAERGVEHSAITDLPPFGIAVLPFKDPDGLALELHRPPVATEQQRRPDVVHRHLTALAWVCGTAGVPYGDSHEHGVVAAAPGACPHVGD